MNEQKINIKLPKHITVHIPAFSDLSLDDVSRVIATTGIDTIKDRIQELVLKAFLEEHEPYIQSEVQRLLSTKREEIKKLLEK